MVVFVEVVVVVAVFGVVVFVVVGVVVWLLLWWCLLWWWWLWLLWCLLCGNDDMVVSIVDVAGQREGGRYWWHVLRSLVRHRLCSFDSGRMICPRMHSLLLGFHVNLLRCTLKSHTSTDSITMWSLRLGPTTIQTSNRW